MKKRILSFLSALILAVTTLTGCGISDAELEKEIVSGVISGLSDLADEVEEQVEIYLPEITTTTSGTSATASETTVVKTETTTTTTTATEEVAPEVVIDFDGSYTTKDDVALYIYTYGCLPSNFITKKEAQALGWEGGSLEPYAPGMCIGGSYFGNYEGLLPEKDGRKYTECDIDTLGAEKRGAKRIVFSNDGLIYYTEDHYESFELLYGEE